MVLSLLPLLLSHVQIRESMAHVDSSATSSNSECVSRREAETVCVHNKKGVFISLSVVMKFDVHSYRQPLYFDIQ